MSFNHEATFKFDISTVTGEVQRVWEDRWYPLIGVPNMDFLVDTRNRAVAGTAVLDIKPAIQLATYRIDRPGAGAPITAGSVIRANGLTKYQETTDFPNTTDFYFRRGLEFFLSTLGNTPFGRAEGVVYSAWRSFGQVLPPEEIMFNPTNDIAQWSHFPLNGGRPIALNGLTHVKLLVFGIGNLNTAMSFQLAGRVYNDTLARGEYSLIGNAVSSTTPDFSLDTGEQPISGLTPASYQWGDFALAVHKGTDPSANSRCLFRVIPALKRS